MNFPKQAFSYKFIVAVILDQKSDIFYEPYITWQRNQYM